MENARTFPVEKSQLSMITSMSATLPGTGLGGYATFGGCLTRSRYTRLGPAGVVSVTTGPLNRDGRVTARRGGRLGLCGGDEKPSCSGTARDISIYEAYEHDWGRRTLPIARVVPCIDLPLPYALEVFSAVNERGRLAERDGCWPGTFVGAKPFVYREDKVKGGEEAEEKEDGASSPAEAGDAGLVEARDVGGEQTEARCADAWDGERERC